MFYGEAGRVVCTRDSTTTRVPLTLLPLMAYFTKLVSTVLVAANPIFGQFIDNV